MIRHWMKSHGTLVLLAVLLVTACATTISVAMRLGTAGDLRTRTEQLTARVLSEQEEAAEAQAEAQAEAPSDNNRQPRQRRADPNDPGSVVAQRITSRNLFTNPPQPQFRNVIGVLGDYALYPGGDMLRAGDQREGATIKTVGPDFVEFEFEGETIRVNIADSAGRGGDGGGGPGGAQAGRRPQRGAAPGAAQFGAGGAPGGENAGAARARGQMTPEQIEEMRARFRGQGGQGGGPGGGGGGRQRGGNGGNNNGN